MRSLQIDFLASGARLINTAVEGSRGIWQRAGVNLATFSGSDLVFPEKGTKLFAGALASSLRGRTGLSHVCNFASSDTEKFLRDTEVEDAAVALQSVAVEIVSVESATVNLNMTVKTTETVIQTPLALT
jgi:hypothetical protein